MRESVVEKYLHRQVTILGGTTIKFVGKINAPDRLVIWPVTIDRPTQFRSANIHFVEVKAPGKKPRAAQLREHKRLRDLGCVVLVIDSKDGVDAYLRNR